MKKGIKDLDEATNYFVFHVTRYVMVGECSFR